jgi:adenylate cyclase
LLNRVWRGRAVGDEAITSCIQEVRRALDDDARSPRYIETRYRRGYRLLAGVAADDVQLTSSAARLERRDLDLNAKSFVNCLDAPGGGASNVVLPDKPSIAVLPFRNMSGDPEQEYFVDGLVEDIVTQLSKFRELLVTARGSSFTYKRRATEIKEVGRNLGVRYLLEGSVRKAGSKVRITGQLIDCETGVHVWADRFDGTLENVFDLQDQVTSNVVWAITPAVQLAETERTRRKPTDNLDAYDWFLRGSAAVWEGRAREAIIHLKKAIERDDRYAEAYGMCAGAYVTVAAFEGTLISPDEKAEALKFADMAATLGTDDALALARAAHALVFFGKEYERSSAMIERAVALNPNLSSVWLMRGWVNVLSSDVERAKNSFSRVLQFSELDPARSVRAVTCRSAASTWADMKKDARGQRKPCRSTLLPSTSDH